jgi:hypothetical protein
MCKPLGRGSSVTIVAELHVWLVTRFVQRIPPDLDWLNLEIESLPVSGVLARQFIP